MRAHRPASTPPNPSPRNPAWPASTTGTPPAATHSPDSDVTPPPHRPTGGPATSPRPPPRSPTSRHAPRSTPRPAEQLLSALFGGPELAEHDHHVRDFGRSGQRAEVPWSNG